MEFLRWLVVHFSDGSFCFNRLFNGCQINTLISLGY